MSEQSRLAVTKKQLNARTRWMEALASGKYKQIQNALRLDPPEEEKDEKPGFCCLGLASEISDSGTVIKCSPESPVEVKPAPGSLARTYTAFSGYAYQIADEQVHESSLPPEQWFAQEFGITEKQADSMQGMLSGMNDNEGGEDGPEFTFTHIADVVRRLFIMFDTLNEVNYEC